MTGIVVFDESHDREVLRRQIHPKDVSEAGVVNRAAFTPRYNGNEADGRMSFLRERVDAAEAWRRYTEGEKRVSAGTWPLEVGVARAEGLLCGDDSAVEGVPDDHAFVHVEEKPPRSRRAATQAMADWATAQGALFRPPKDQAEPGDDGDDRVASRS